MFPLYIFIVFITNISAQDNWETGKPIITTYNCVDIEMNTQIWDFVKDSRGVVYVGSAPGVFEFDGSTWRSIPTANRTHGRSLAIDKNDRVYVGASGDIGYLIPDDKGELIFQSLMSNLPEKNRTFSYIWTTSILNDEIYFQSFEGIFRFTHVKKSNDNSEKTDKLDWEVKVWEPEVRFNYSFSLNNSYYVQQGGVGLMKMVNDSLILLPGGEQFANDRLQVMLPYNKDGNTQILVGTFNRGLFLFDGKSFKPFKCEADLFLRESTLYKGKILDDGDYVFATLNGGMIIMDKEGKIKLSLNKKTGLSSNSVTSLFIDQGLIWMAPEGSISVVEYPSPITVFDESVGQISLVQNMTRYKGTMYFSTTNGVFYLDKKTTTIKQLTGFIPGNNQSFQVVKIQDQLLVTYGTGLYRIDGTNVFLIKEASGLSFIPNFIHQSLQDSNRIFVGLIDGLSTFYLDKKGTWIYEGRISSIDEYILTLMEIEPGVIWGATDNNGALRIDFRERVLSSPEIKRFSTEQGLPPGGSNMYKISGRGYFIFWDGVYSYDDNTEVFTKDSLFTSLGQVDYASVGMVEDKYGNLWFTTANHVTFFSLQKDNSYKTKNTFTSRLSSDYIVSIYPEDNGTVWFGGGINVYKFDQNSGNDNDEKFNTLIRKVVVGEDSVLFGGLLTKTIPKIDYSNNSMVFEFSATSMIDPSATEYQSILEGFDEKWSTWKNDSYRNYTNLPSGDYTFKVKGKNLYHIESEEASFSFSILPPWYRSWFAYAGYVILLGFGIFTVDRLQRRRLTKKERERARIHEVELRAETAEAKSMALQAENDRKKNVELLSEIGRDITANLTIKEIIDTVYENVNSLMDATVFGIGLYNEKMNRIDFPASKEKGETLEPFYNSLDDERPSVWCFKNQKEILVNDYSVEYKKYVKELKKAVAGDNPESMLYLPLTYKDKKIGVITAQSFKKNSYSDYHLNILRNLATYTAIAIDNADAYRQLNETVNKLDLALNDLKATQEKLITQEKLASLGQLTAGIAHEIKNPLNFVNNFAQLAKELVDELREEFDNIKEKLSAEFIENFEDLLNNIEQNVTKTNEHGKRADSIVRSMLQHSRGKTGERILSDINAVLEEDINLAYHGLRARDASFNITIEKELDFSLEKISIIPQDVSRVFLNIINNGFYEANKKKKSLVNNFNPTLCVKTINRKDTVEVRIKDNGNGIPPEARDKLFNPFFTTKPAGEGTGLGLSLSYDIIVKEHRGEIKFETEPGEFTEFIISLPKNGK
jgi:signal transduction histidine kinase/ligand-binding sensor domain-containing protein